MCKSFRSRQELSNEYLQNSASIQPRTSLSKFAKNEPKVRKTVRKNIGRDGSDDAAATKRNAEPDDPDEHGHAHGHGHGGRCGRPAEDAKRRDSTAGAPRRG